jgi:hypothetical protein
MWLLLLITVVNSQRDACPSPKERAGAWNIGQTCDNMRRSCCFDEVIADSNGNLTNVSCCYTYGTAGPIKCCGWTYFPLWVLGIIIPMAVWLTTVGSLMALRAYAENNCEKDKEDDTPTPEKDDIQNPEEENLIDVTEQEMSEVSIVFSST